MEHSGEVGTPSSAWFKSPIAGECSFFLFRVSIHLWKRNDSFSRSTNWQSCSSRACRELDLNLVDLIERKQPKNDDSYKKKGIWPGSYAKRVHRTVAVANRPPFKRVIHFHEICPSFIRTRRRGPEQCACLSRAERREYLSDGRVADDISIWNLKCFIFNFRRTEFFWYYYYFISRNTETRKKCIFVFSYKSYPESNRAESGLQVVGLQIRASIQYSIWIANQKSSSPAEKIVPNATLKCIPQMQTQQKHTHGNCGQRGPCWTKTLYVHVRMFLLLPVARNTAR